MMYIRFFIISLFIVFVVSAGFYVVRNRDRISFSTPRLVDFSGLFNILGTSKTQKQQPSSTRDMGTPVASIPRSSEISSGSAAPSVTSLPYGKGKVSLRSVTKRTRSQSAIIVLGTSMSAGELVNITGWKIKTKAFEVMIPQAAAIYFPGGNIAPSDIILKAGDKVNLYASAAQPFSYRLNTCFGYLQPEYQFSPSVANMCPKAYQTEAELAQYNNQCYSYIKSLKTCQDPPSNLPESYGDRCIEFLNTLNYEGCFNKHRNDEDFMSSEWRVYLGANSENILDPVRDQVQLLNKTGELISEYIY